MPALGLQQESGMLVAWLKAEGEPVAKGEPLMQIETDKATVEIEAPVTGVLAAVRAREGETVPVGQVMAWIVAPGEAVPGEASRPAEANGAGPATGPAARETQRREPETPAGPPALAPASPLARRLARERGIEIEALAGSGPEGAVLAGDVPAAQGRAGAAGTRWQLMAERVSRSWASAPHFFLLREADASALVAWRAAAQQQNRSGVTYTDLFVKLAAVALRRHPGINAQWNEGQIVVHPEVNVGIATAVPDGLVVPVLHGADELSLRQIADRRAGLVQRAQAGRLTAQDLAGGTFTVSNLGMYGVDAFLAILNPPQAAILAVGRIAERVVAVKGQPAVRPTVMLTLSCDHRVVDGARAAEFLAILTGLIEEPLQLA